MCPRLVLALSLGLMLPVNSHLVWCCPQSIFSTPQSCTALHSLSNLSPEVCQAGKSSEILTAAEQHQTIKCSGHPTQSAWLPTPQSLSIVSLALVETANPNNLNNVMQSKVEHRMSIQSWQFPDCLYRKCKKLFLRLSCKHHDQSNYSK